ncbi:DUF3363 domain-containing protein [Caulobacter sp. S45]|uniref:relaxase/mobilization nuclease domain-containing protein n=1 Tax=Caulobacter sp. S45 TaxID=1641861 RepID=UPI00157534F8|nr:DUF3363 domain-containing protein [Caulobacter sp. S45]
MSAGEDEVSVRLGRIRHSRGAEAKSFVGQVMQAARKAGQTGRVFGSRRQGGGSSRFGRGRAAAIGRSLRSPTRRVVIKARVVRHVGAKFRAAPLARHGAYLRRDGVTRDGVPAQMFDTNSEQADVKAFAERCEDDRHHFRFTISPEDADQMGDLRAFTRELMADAERDLGGRLDWVAVDHWNTDNPHIHLLVRGRAEDGQDLVISRDYISRGLRMRAEDRVTLELGPRSGHEIGAALQKEVEAERWTSLDRALRAYADEGGGVADLRPEAGAPDPGLRRLMIGRAMKLERLGLAEPAGPAAWILKPDAEKTLRELSIRGDIIKTLHRAMARGDGTPDVARFAIHDENVSEPVLGRLVERGLHDEVEGSAYAIVDGADGRIHHLRFGDLEMTGDTRPGALVELRAWEDVNGRRRSALAVRSDLSLEAQVTADGATWLDRQLIARDPAPTAGGFGGEIRAAMSRRADHLLAEGLAQRAGGRTVYVQGLIDTLRRRELDASAARLADETGLVRTPSASGDVVAGIYRQRLALASGRFAMIDDGLGFQLVPWRPALDQHLGQNVSGTMLPGGGVDWNLGRKRGLGR